MLFSSSDQLKVEIVAGMLTANDINVLKMNKQDSAHVHIGDLALYVHRDQLVRAKYLISEAGV